MLGLAAVLGSETYNSSRKIVLCNLTQGLYSKAKSDVALDLAFNRFLSVSNYGSNWNNVLFPMTV